MTKFFTLSQGEGGSQTYQYFMPLFFTLSVGGEGGMVNDTNFTLYTVFFLDVFPKLLLQELFWLLLS